MAGIIRQRFSEFLHHVAEWVDIIGSEGHVASVFRQENCFQVKREVIFAVKWVYR
jgi:hypothetical protein